MNGDFIADLIIYSLLVHILSGDLIHHKRSLEPIKTLIYNLRRYDEERAMAVADQGHSVPPPTRPSSPTHQANPSHGRGPPPNVRNGANEGSLRPQIVVRSSSGDGMGLSSTLTGVHRGQGEKNRGWVLVHRTHSFFFSDDGLF